MTAPQISPDPPARTRRPIRVIGRVLLVLVVVNAIVLLWAGGAFDSFRQRLERTLNPPRTSGFIRQTYVDAGGQQHDYYVFVPHQRHRGNLLPTIVYLNGLGENGSGGLAPLRNGLAEAIWEDEADFPFLVVWPQCEEDDQWVPESRSTLRALAIMQESLKKYGGDPDQVVITGISAGGTGAWELAASYPDMFSAVIPISGIPNIERVEDIITAKMPVWMYYVSDDTPVIGETCQRVQRELLRGGQSPRLTQVPANGNTNLDFHDAWSFAFRDAGMYQWICSQHRSHRGTQSLPWAFVMPDSLFDQSQSPKANISINNQEIVHVETTSDNPIPLSIPLPRLCEVEFEFKLAADCEQIRFGIVPMRPVPDQVALVQLDLMSIPFPDGRLRLGTKHLNPLDLTCCQALRPHDWNHLRMEWINHSYSIELNGRTLSDRAVQSSLPAEWQLTFAVGSSLPAGFEVRNLRWRGFPPRSTAQSEFESVTSVDMTENRGQADSLPAQDEDLIALMTSAWKAREKRLSDLVLRWRIAPHFHGYECGPFPDKGVELPRQHQLHLTPKSWHYSGPWPHRRLDLTRMEGLTGEMSLKDFSVAQQSAFAESTSTLRDRRWTVDVDGSHRRDVVSGLDGVGERGVLFAEPDATAWRPGDADDARWRGAVLACRPWTALSHIAPPDQWIVRSRETRLGELAPVVIEVPVPSAPALKQSFDVDPSRDFLIVRSCLLRDGKLLELIDLEYEQDERDNWIPDRWAVSTRSARRETISSPPFPGKEWLFHTESAESVLVSIPREVDSPEGPVASVASLPFPTGTIIYDQSQKTFSRQSRWGGRETLTPAEAAALASRPLSEED